MTETEKTASDVVIVGAARTPFGKLLGGLSAEPATELGALAIRGALPARTSPATRSTRPPTSAPCGSAPNATA